MKFWYSERIKTLILGALHKCQTDEELKNGVQVLRQANPLFAHLSVSRVKYWRKMLNHEYRKRGRQICEEFESDVWNRLVSSYTITVFLIS